MVHSTGGEQKQVYFVDTQGSIGADEDLPLVDKLVVRTLCIVSVSLDVLDRQVLL